MRKLEDSYEKCYRDRLAFDIFAMGLKSILVPTGCTEGLMCWFLRGLKEFSIGASTYFDGLKNFWFELDKTKNATNRLNRDRCISSSKQKQDHGYCSKGGAGCCS